MRLAVLGLTMAAALPATGASAADNVAPRTVVKDAVYRDVDGRPLHLDIYVHPDAGKTPGPVLVHFHGGGWARGARPESWTGFRAYLAAGFSVITVQYRLAGQAPAPAAVQDARCVLHWVGANASRFGFDSRRIVVSGTSAGGHLALMTGLLPPANDVDPDDCKQGPKAAAILDFYGPTDLTATDGTKRHPTIANWIGTGAGAAAMERRMSPVAWLSAASPPVFIGHGDADPVVPVAQSTELKRRLDALAVPSDIFVVAGGGHGKFDPASQSAMTARALTFLCGRGIPTPAACGTKN